MCNLSLLSPAQIVRMFVLHHVLPCVNFCGTSFSNGKLFYFHVHSLIKVTVVNIVVFQEIRVLRIRW